MAKLDSVLPNIMVVSSYLEASVVHSCLRAIVRLKLPDAIGDDAPLLAEIADAVKAKVSALKRVLRLLEAHEFVRFQGERVRLTPRGQLLRSNVSPSLFTMFAAPGYFEADHLLEHTLRTGEPAFTKAKGVDFWDYLRSNEAEARIFDEAMRKQGELLNITAVPQLEIANSKVVVDVGGGTGSLLLAVLAAYPKVTGVLFDREDVIAGARPILQESPFATRCSFVGGDLKGRIPSGNCYLLARILHDWSDDDARTILSAIRDAAKPSAILNILEMVIPPGADRHVSKYSDITMLGLFCGGRERTEEEFAELLRSSGWTLEKIFISPIKEIPTNVLIARVSQ